LKNRVNCNSGWNEFEDKKMQLRIRASLLMGGLIIILGIAGCRNPEEPTSKEGPTVTVSDNGMVPRNQAISEGGADNENPLSPENGLNATGDASDEPTPPPTIPTVALDAASEATCLVKVSDPFPAGTLVDVAGNSVPLKPLLDDRLVVVYFWTSKNPYAVAGLKDLGSLVPRELSDEGAVRVIAVNEGDTPAGVKPLLDETGEHVMNLFDPEGEFFRTVATSILPRVYLIDSEGRIVWFDIEYSQSMKRDLRQALEVALSTKPASQQASP